MIKQTLTYNGFDGREYTEDFYFNLTKAEVIEVNVGEDQDLGSALEAVTRSKNGKLIMSTFKEILEKAYGVKSDDGKRFMKSPEIYAKFAESEAYSELFMKIVTDAEFASEFINGVLPNGQVTEQKAAVSSEEARARSEAQMQGHRQPEPKLETVQVPVETAEQKEIRELRAKLAAAPTAQDPMHNDPRNGVEIQNFGSQQ